jgi:hypothetical protein
MNATRGIQFRKEVLSVVQKSSLGGESSQGEEGETTATPTSKERLSHFSRLAQPRARFAHLTGWHLSLQQALDTDSLVPKQSFARNGAFFIARYPPFQKLAEGSSQWRKYAPFVE